MSIYLTSGARGMNNSIYNNSGMNYERARLQNQFQAKNTDVTNANNEKNVWKGVAIASALVMAFIARKPLGKATNWIGNKIATLGTKFSNIKTPQWLKKLPSQISEATKGAAEGATKAAKTVGTVAKGAVEGAGEALKNTKVK